MDMKRRGMRQGVMYDEAGEEMQDADVGWSGACWEEFLYLGVWATYPVPGGSSSLLAFDRSRTNRITILHDNLSKEKKSYRTKAP